MRNWEIGKWGICALFFCAPQVNAQTFVVTVGKDTIAVETFKRTATRMEGELRAPLVTPRLKYTVDFDRNGWPTVLTNIAFKPGGDTAVMQTAVMTFKGDSVIADITTAGRTVTQRLKSAIGAFPFINPSFALMEPVIAEARKRSSVPANARLFTVSGGQVLNAQILFPRSDSVIVVLQGMSVHFKTDSEGRILRGFAPQQNLLIVRSNDVVNAPAGPNRDYSAPLNAAFTAEDVDVPTSEGFTLAGTLTKPKSAPRRFPVVITISGSGQEDRDEAIPSVSGYKPFRQIAEALANAGIATLRYDDRGFGSSGGNPMSATSADFANDTRAIIAYLRKRPDIDTTRIFLLGHSEGGMIAPMIAAKDRHIRGLVLLAGPSRTGRRILEYQSKYAGTTMAKFDSLAADIPWIRYFMSYDPLPVARKVRAPVLILQGATDRQITAVQAPELARAFRAGGNRDVTMRVLPGVNHLFLKDPDGNPAKYGQLKDTAVSSNVVAYITDWIIKHAR